MQSTVRTTIQQRVASNGVPRDHALEQAVLGCMLLDATCIEYAIEADIDGECFYDSANREIFDTIIKIKYGDGFNVDLVTLKNRLQGNEKFKDKSQRELAIFLMELEDASFTTTHFLQYIRILEEYKHRRQLIFDSINAIEMAYDTKGPIDADFLPHKDNIKKLDIARCLANDPPPRKWIFENFLPQGIISSLNASGGTGKSYLALYFAISLATGMQIFQCFKPAQPRSVICWFGEDAEDVLHERIRSIVDSCEHFNSELLNENLNIYCEQAKPLMELDANKPVITKSYLWLKSKIKQLNPGLVIIDPKSKFFGLDEICNTHAAIWLNSLQELITPEITILVIHHVNKSGANLFDSASARGASAFVDGCRWAASMRIMDKETGAKYDIDNHRAYVELLVTKSNYTILPSEPLRFRHMEGGGMEQVEVDQPRHGDIAVAIQEALKNNPDKLISENEISRLPVGKFVRDYIKEYHSKVSRIDIKNAIYHGLQTGILHQLEIVAGTKSKWIIST